MGLNDHDPAALLHPDTARSLLDQAIEARAHAYAPYSRFSVGAALLARDGRVFTGVNVENASYGLSNCAERTAIFKAVSEGVREFSAIAVIGPQNDVECSPCGACRQVLFEFGPDMVVVLADGDGLKQFTARGLLPGAFEAERLPRTEVPV
jgi:cytidine deaminase